MLLSLTQTKTRNSIEVKSGKVSFDILKIGGASDHGRIVRAEDRGRAVKCCTLCVTHFLHPRTQRCVGGNTAGQGKFLKAVLVDRVTRMGYQYVDDCLLKGSCNIGDIYPRPPAGRRRRHRAHSP